MIVIDTPHGMVQIIIFKKDKKNKNIEMGHFKYVVKKI